MVKAELTGSTTKPLPTHNPWSGGSNCAPKLVFALSRLLTPLKPSSSCDVFDTCEEELTCGPWLDPAWCKWRVPLGYVKPGVVKSFVIVSFVGSTTAKGVSVPVVASGCEALAACVAYPRDTSPLIIKAPTIAARTRRETPILMRVEKRVELPHFQIALKAYRGRDSGQ